jgi:GTPase SAR1 family protein
MRIVMIGHTNAGKTTYMAMMYRLMNGKKGYEGFRIVANDSARHAELLDNAGAIDSGRYPPPTARHSEYDFTLYFDGREVSDFTWNDYRGGAIMERSTSADTAKLLKEIADSDAVVIFADAYELATNPASHNDVQELTDLMHRAISDSGSGKPLVLAFTKADLVRSTAEWAVALEPFEQVIQAMDQSRDIKATTVTVACGDRPKAVQMPVLWCLSYGLANQAKKLRDDVARYRKRAEEHAKNDTIGNRFGSWLRDEESEHKKQLRYLAWAEENLAELAPLEQRAHQLAKALRKAQRKDAPPRIVRKASRR